jgi:hypothetical protein
MVEGWEIGGVSGVLEGLGEERQSECLGSAANHGQL